MGVKSTEIPATTVPIKTNKNNDVKRFLNKNWEFQQKAQVICKKTQILSKNHKKKPD
ncbi:MAG: hypothetical protein WC765_03825 [Phycisphaerae bacterium]